jgi:hypothetical protein
MYSFFARVGHPDIIIIDIIIIVIIIIVLSVFHKVKYLFYISPVLLVWRRTANQTGEYATAWDFELRSQRLINGFRTSPQEFNT